MKSSTKDRAESNMHQAKSKIKESAGEIVGNRSMEAEGQIENLEGKVQEKVSSLNFIADPYFYKMSKEEYQTKQLDNTVNSTFFYIFP